MPATLHRGHSPRCHQRSISDSPSVTRYSLIRPKAQLSHPGIEGFTIHAWGSVPLERLSSELRMALRSEDFDPIPESARAVRRFLQESLPEVAPIDDIVLDGSELASNAIRHARTEFSVRLVSDAELVRLEVSDGSSINPAMESLAE